MERRQSNPKLIACLLVAMVAGLVVACWLIMQEPPKQRLTVLGKFVAFIAIGVPAVWLLEIAVAFLERQFKRKR